MSALAKNSEAERPQIVQPEDVVSVSVGVENGVDARQLVSQCLFAKVRAGVNQHNPVALALSPLQQQRGPQPLVTGIR